MSAQHDLTETHEDETSRSTEIALTKHAWDKPWKGAFLQAYALSANISQAARAAGISREQVYEVKAKDPVFAGALVEAREVGTDMLEQLARRRVTEERQLRVVRTRTLTDSAGRTLEREVTEEVREQKGASDGLIATMLKAHRPEVYMDRLETRHTGPDGGPIVVEVTRSPDRERLLELVRIAADLEQSDVIDGEVVDEAELET